VMVPEVPGTFSNAKSPDGVTGIVAEKVPDFSVTWAVETEAPLESWTVPSTRT
jgi:hypothetical protein